MMMFSMAGIPFFVGFFAKFSVLQAVVAAGYMWLAIVAVLFSLIGAFYYLRVVKLMYFDPPADTSPLTAGIGHAHPDLRQRPCRRTARHFPADASCRSAPMGPAALALIVLAM